MKVSEAIDQLEVGDTVWVRSEVNYINKAEMFPICCDLAETSIWICGVDEISVSEPNSISDEKVLELVSTNFRFDKENFWNQLKEMDMLPQAEKVEVPDFVANYIETEKRRDSASIDEVFSPGFVNEWDEVNKWLYDNPTEENERRYLMAIRAYVDGYTVKPKRWVVKNGDKYFGKFLGSGLARAWVIYQYQAYPFDDHAKAEAVAVLVEGSVEEV